MKLTILYEDEHIVAIEKPVGLVVHNDGKTKEPAVTDWVLKQYPDTKNVGEPINLSNGTVLYRPGIVHRLDRDTSGVLLIAKTDVGFATLKEQFQEHNIQKKYSAFVYGNLKTDTGVIDRPIGRSTQDFRLWSAQRGARGEMREALTEYRVIARVKDYTFVSIFPKTGRTHQIRVHFKAIHHPLVADSLYAPKRDNTLGFDRVALHAKEISFMSVEGERQTVTCPYPQDFLTALQMLQIKE